MKKRIISLALVVCLLAVAIVGGTMAYFTDTDSANNVMTIGKVDIRLNERMRNPEKEDLELIAFNGTNVRVMPLEYEDGIYAYNKVVDVHNDGNTDAYIRTIIAIDMDAFKTDSWQEGMNNGNAEDDMIHISWAKTCAAIQEIDPVQIDGKWYAVFVVADKEKDATAPGGKVQPLQSIWLDETVNNADVAAFNGSVTVKVLTQAVQTEGFESFDDAFNATFGAVTAAKLTEWF